MSTDVRLAPLSFEQERMWLLDQLAPGNPANHIRGAVTITGALDHAVLEQSINALIERHEILRTRFGLVDGQPHQVIGMPWRLRLPVTDLQGIPAHERSAESQRLAAQLVQQPFDLTQTPLWRVQLLQLTETSHTLVLCMHHSICDGDWSLGIFFQEVATLHDALISGKPFPLQALPLQYQDFVRRQRAQFTDAVLAPHLAYWKQQLGEEAGVLQLPTDRPRPAMQTYAGACQKFILSAPLTEMLDQLSQQANVPVFVTLLAAFKTLLYRYTGQEAITLGVPTAGRHEPALDGLIGYFGNPVVLRTYLAGELTFRDLLARVRAVADQAETHQQYPFQKLVGELNLARDLSLSPLFQILFVMRNAAPRTWTQGLMASQTIGALTLTPLDIESTAVPYDLFVSIQASAQGLVWTWEYNTDLFEHATIRRMLGHCQQLLAQVATHPDQPIGALPLLTDDERQQLLVAWNQTQTTYPRLPIHKLFEDQTMRTPEAVAVACDDTVTRWQGDKVTDLPDIDVTLSPPHPVTVSQLTYAELNARANQLADYLQQHGVGPDQPVGICLERSPEMIIAILGILKAGGAYVPLDAAYPVERLLYMLANSAARVLITTTTQLALVPQLARSTQPCEIICLDKAWPTIAKASTADLVNGVHADHLAYVIYTSGSTGQPKGVALEHHVLTNLITWHQANRLVGNGVKMLQFSPISFDVSAHEIFATLCSGGTLVLVAEDVRRNPLALLAFIRAHGIEKLYAPFIALHQLAEAAEVAPGPIPLREVITAGEQLQITPAIVNFFVQSGATLHNHYGGTEIQDVTAFTLTGAPHQWPALPAIGRPINNSQIYLLDQHHQPVPIGVAGELYVGGDGLARGYLNRSELTAEKFIPYELRVANCELRSSDPNSQLATRNSCTRPAISPATCQMATWNIWGE